MDELPGLPAEVPQEYRQKLIKFQNQIKILINNHQVRFGFPTNGGFE